MNLDRWQRTVASLRATKNPAPDEKIVPPAGFATRVLAARRSERRTRLAWRRWALGAAAVSGAGWVWIVTVAPEPAPQFLPVPTIDFPTPS